MLAKTGWLLQRYWLETLMILPLALYIMLLTFVPVLQAIGLSFTDRYTEAFPTLSNYQYIIGRPDFADAFVNTIGITLMGVTMEMTVGLILALMLARQFAGRGFFRTVILTPMGVPTLVAGAAMLYFFRTNGYLNEALLRLGLIDVPIYWTESGLRGMFAVALADMWKVTPIVVLLLLAGLESIPRDVYEAADVDGASAWDAFRSITIPLLMPAITMALIVRAIDAFRIFDVVMVMASRSIPVMSTFVYSNYFDYQDPYTASAAATILLLMIVAFIAAYFFLVERRRGELA
ncbi:MAG: carbohydrate ABC transporter permease [Chloroflexota bacterium]